MATLFWERKGVLKVDVIYATEDHKNVRNILQNTKRTA
jgi:hypothetical protein